ncbi:glutathione S-transferase family protein [Bradyrhizobium diazoefficiens]|nr:glutathione S-transferase family protein [Bradyrhizobium diazoefficiens]MBR0775584.1 glutathione S-transferase family protein [Bradyrhizobium diazoefficiens]
MAELEIMGVPFSNYVRSIRMLCEEKGVTYKLTPSRPQSPEVKAIHPAGQIPVMRHGDVTLFESKAIATYIDRTFPGQKFIPDDTLETAQVEQWVSYGNVKVDRWIMREFVVPSAFFDKAKGPDTARIAAALPEIDKCCKALDNGVAQTGHLVGSRLTYADMNVIPMLSLLLNFPAGKEIMAKYRSLCAYVESLANLPSFTNTAALPRR